MEPAGTPIPKAQLPAIKSRPLNQSSQADKDIRITVHSFDARALRRAVSLMPLPAKIRKRVSYTRTRDTFTLVIRGGRVIWNDHQQNDWMSPVMRRLKKVYKVKPLFAQL